MEAQAIPIHADLDFLQTGTQSWDLEIDTDAGRILLSNGGATMRVNDELVSDTPNKEYPALYARFATLARERKIDADAEPLRLVAEALASGQVHVAPAFHY